MSEPEKRKYTREFRADAVKLVQEQGVKLDVRQKAKFSFITLLT